MIDDTRGNFRVGMRLHKLIRRKTGKRKGKERKGKIHASRRHRRTFYRQHDREIEHYENLIGNVP